MLKREPRLSFHTLKVLAAFVDAAPRPLAGADLAAEASLTSGTLYPILKRLEDAGWLSSQWEDLDPREVKRPRRRYYSITAVGARKARRALAEIGQKRFELVPGEA